MKKIFKFALMFMLIIPFSFLFYGCEMNTIYAGKNLTLENAINQAKDGAIIKLDENITLTSQVNVNKKVTIDLGGYTINNTDDIWSVTDKNWSLISVKEGGELTIKNGTIKAKENDCYAIDVRDGGKLTIESGKYIGNVHSIYIYQGEAYINGGEFDIQQESEVTGDSRYTLNCYDANYRASTAKIYVKGGKFANYNPSGSQSENPTADFVIDGYKVEQSVENGETWYTVVAE